MLPIHSAKEQFVTTQSAQLDQSELCTGSTFLKSTFLLQF